jgi:acetylornithine deacetylase/succinyl-diaminopimelate desuccinylase-like protein
MRIAICLLVASLGSGVSVAADFDAPYQRQALELFRRSIAFKTEIGQGQVPLLAAYLADQFRAAGFPDEDIHILPLGETASLVVRYRGNGSGGRPITAIAHMDVVTAKPEDWQRDPFTLVEQGGYFFGRGSVDVKCGLVALTSAFLRLKAEGYVPDRDLILAFSGDEETAQATAADLAQHHRELVDAEFVLNSDAGGGALDEKTGRPVLYGIENSEKSYASFELTVRNPGGHSSLPRADNAIYELADNLQKIRHLQFPVMWTAETREWFRVMAGQTSDPKLSAAMRRFAANPRDPQADRVLAAEPSLVGRTRTTCVPTLLRGGHADNALPQSATATINCRIFPGVEPASVQAALQNRVGPKAEVRPTSAPVYVSGPSPMRPDLLQAVTQVLHSLHDDVPIVPQQESGASDCVIFRAAGIACYGTSETFIKDSDDFAHGLNERVPVASFYQGLDFWYQLFKDLSSPATH